MLALLAALASAAYICRAAPAALGPQLRADLGLSETQLGFVFSAFLLGYTVMQAPTGWLADRMRVRTMFGAIAPAKAPCHVDGAKQKQRQARLPRLGL